MPGLINDCSVSSILTFTEALDRCWQGSGITAQEMAWRLGIKYSHFVRMMRVEDNRHFPPDKIPAVMNESRNLLPLEWLAWRHGQAIYPVAMMEVLEGIRQALTKDGRSVQFSISANGTVRLL